MRKRDMEEAKPTVPPVDCEALAREMSPAIVAAQPEVFFGYRAAHEEDVKSYVFRCERYGDFLSVFIARGGEKHVAAINLRAHEIRLVEGHGPDLLGEVRFRKYSRSGDGYSIRSGASPSNLNHVIAEAPRAPYLRPMFYPVDEKAASQFYDGQGYAPLAAHKLANAPRAAEDDRIEFVGSGTLQTPAGLGEGVYQQILAALGAGER